MGDVLKFEDAAREARIDDLRTQAETLMWDGDYSGAGILWDMLASEVAARSPEQVARMERNRGLR